MVAVDAKRGDLQGERRRARLVEALVHGCESLGSALLSAPENASLRERVERGALDAAAFSARVASLIGALLVQSWCDGRGLATSNRPPLRTDSAWRQLLSLIRRAHEGPLGSALSTLDPVVCDATALDELAALEVDDERAQSVSNAVLLETRGGVVRAWDRIEADELVAALATLHAHAPSLLTAPWALRLRAPDRPAYGSSSRAAVERVLSRTLQMQRQLAGVLRLDADALSFVDPRCGAGEVLCAALPMLSSEPAALIGRRVFGAASDRTHVALARLSLWLRAPRVIDGSTLRAAVLLRDSAEFAARVASLAPYARLLVTDVADDEELAALADCLTLMGERSAVGLVIDSRCAWRPTLFSPLSEASRAISLDLPFIEPRWSVDDVRRSRLAWVGRRSETAQLERRSAWPSRLDLQDIASSTLLEHLTGWARVARVATQVEPSSPRGAPLVAVDCSADALRASVVGAHAKGPMLFAPRGVDAPVLAAVLNSTVARWQLAMRAAARGRSVRDATADDVLELSWLFEPRASERERLADVQQRAVQEGWTAALQRSLDLLVFAGAELDRDQRALLEAWREAAAPTAATVDADAPARGALTAERTTSIAAVVPSSRGDRRAVDSRALAVGRGVEGAQRTRADDGRAAPTLGPKRSLAQPEDDVEREVWAILRAANAQEGMPLDELCRRAREHTSDEFAAAIERLRLCGWIELSEDPRPVVWAVSSERRKVHPGM